MHFFYAAQYDPEDRNSRPHESPESTTQSLPSELRTNVEMFILADMLLSDRLKNFAYERIIESLTKPVPTDLCTVLELSFSQSNSMSLPFQQALVAFCSRNPDALYGESAGQGMKNLPSDFFLQVLRCSTEIRHQEHETKVGELETLLSKTQDLCRFYVQCGGCKGRRNIVLQTNRRSGNLPWPQLRCIKCHWSYPVES